MTYEQHEHDYQRRGWKKFLVVFRRLDWEGKERELDFLTVWATTKKQARSSTQHGYLDVWLSRWVGSKKRSPKIIRVEEISQDTPALVALLAARLREIEREEMTPALEREQHNLWRLRTAIKEPLLG